MFDFGAVITDITKEEVGNYVKLLRNLQEAIFFRIITTQYYVKEHWLEWFSLSEPIRPMNCRISYSLYVSQRSISVIRTDFIYVLYKIKPPSLWWCVVHLAPPTYTYTDFVIPQKIIKIKVIRIQLCSN